MTGGRGGRSITEAELHAYVDGQLAPARREAVEAYLAERPHERARVAAWRRDVAALRALLDPVMREPVPGRMLPAPRRIRASPRRVVLALAIAVVSAAAGWMAHGVVHEVGAERAALAVRGGAVAPFAREAAIAHVVYSPEIRAPVERGAEHQDQLVAWLSRRMGAAVNPPRLEALGYSLIGGRLLPGERGTVAQFMYHDGSGQRLTLYVAKAGTDRRDSKFRYVQDGPVNVYYWADERFGYAVSAGADRTEINRVAQEIYRQLSSV